MHDSGGSTYSILTNLPIKKAIIDVTNRENHIYACDFFWLCMTLSLTKHSGPSHAPLTFACEPLAERILWFEEKKKGCKSNLLSISLQKFFFVNHWPSRLLDIGYRFFYRDEKNTHIMWIFWCSFFGQKIWQVLHSTLVLFSQQTSVFQSIKIFKRGITFHKVVFAASPRRTKAGKCTSHQFLD